ncbi:MAG: hypothetical protein GXO32_07800 [Crenarchaeota archaeon]|nr:hypothetical protein [Thermoproteota archaeon]
MGRVQLLKLSCGRRNGFVVRVRSGPYSLRSVVEDQQVSVPEGAEYLEVEAFFNPPESCSYSFLIQSPTTPILYVEGRALETARIERGYETRSIRLSRGSFYRVKIELPHPVPGSRISLWVSYLDLIEPAVCRCYAPSSPYITLLSVPNGASVELVNIGVIARGSGRGGLAQVDVSHLKQPIRCRLVINGVEVAELVEAWGGDVYSIGLRSLEG